MKKKLWSIVLALALCLGLMSGMSLTASAAEARPTFSGGTGTEADPFLLSTPNDLTAFHTAISNDDGSLDAVDECSLGMYHGYYFELTNDIDMASVPWTPVSFCGNLNGNGHTIKNLSVTEADNGSGEYWAAMFGQLINATVSNIAFENCSAAISSTTNSSRDIYVAIVAANAIASKLENVTVVNSTVTQEGYAKNMGYAAFITALADISNITGCIVDGGSISVTATTTNPMNVGGITGCFEDLYYEFIAYYDNPYNMVIGAGSDYGIYDCYVNANITVDTKGGNTSGIVGMTCTDYLDATVQNGVAAVISNCVFKGTITATKGQATGISSWDEPQDQIIDCVSLATLSAPTTYPLCELPTTVTNSYYLVDVADGQGGRTAEQFANGVVCTGRGGHFMVDDVCVLCGYATPYTVTVENGTGSGDYAKGTSVTIKANAPEAGKKFAGWTGTDGLTFTSGSAATAEATFTMPAKAVTVTATYADLLPGKVIVNGVELVNGDDDHTVACGDGTAVYDPDTQTLTLTNAEITSHSGQALAAAGIYISDFDKEVTIKLVGENSITLTDPEYDSTGIHKWGDNQLTITGSGSLGVTTYDDSSPQGITGGNGPILIKNVAMTFVLADGSKDNGNLIHSNKDITIDGAVITAPGGYLSGLTTSAMGSITIKNKADLNISALENAIYSEGNILIEDSSVDVCGTDYAAICGWADISITDSTVMAHSDWDNGVYCYGHITISGGKATITSTETDALRANGGITIKDNADVTAEGYGAGVYTNEILTVESGKLTAKGEYWSILARRISGNAEDSKPTDSPAAIVLGNGMAEVSGTKIKTDDWTYTEVWDDWEYDYYDKWMSQSYFTNADGDVLTEVTIVPFYTVTLNGNGAGLDLAIENIPSSRSANDAFHAQGYIGDAGEELGRNMVREGYTFVGWYLNEDGTGDPYDFDSAVTGDITLYAKWSAKPAQTISFDTTDRSATYGDGALEARTATAAGAITYSSSDEAIATVDANGVVTVLKAGEVTITASAAETADYAANTASYTLTIAKKELTITAEDKSAYVGAKQPELTYTVSGLVGSDTLTTLPALTTDADMSKIGEYTITASGADAGSNYDITYVPGKLTVEQIPITLYSINKAECENGKVTAQAVMAAAGSTIKVSATPDAGYKVVSLTVTDAAGNEIEVVDGKIRMPASAVTVSAVFVYDLPYIDVEDDNEHYAAIAYMYVNGLMIGTSTEEYIFSGDMTMTRAQIAQILYRLAGEPVAEYAGTFTDVAENAWYAAAVEWAAAEGIMIGVGNDKFAPNRTITTAEMATLIYRYARCKQNGVCVESDWLTESAEALAWCVDNGILNDASAAANRYLAAEMFYKVYHLLNK